MHCELDGALRALGLLILESFFDLFGIGYELTSMIGLGSITANAVGLQSICLKSISGTQCSAAGRCGSPEAGRCGELRTLGRAARQLSGREGQRPDGEEVR